MNKFGSNRQPGLDPDNPLARKLQRFARLSDEDRQRLAEALSPVREIAARTDLTEEGDDPRAVSVVLHGWACHCRLWPNGNRQIVSLLLPGDPCDLQVSQQNRAHHAIGALTSVGLAQIPGRIVRSLMARSSALEEAFFRERLNASAIQREWTISLGSRSGIERLAHLFCELHERQRIVGLADGDTCPMPITQNDLADAMGQTSVHINRMLQELRGMGLITLRSRRLTILDRARLAALAMFDPLYISNEEPSGRFP